MAVVSIDETADMEYGFITPENVFKQLREILVSTQHQLSIFHSAVAGFKCQLLHMMGFPWAKSNSSFNTLTHHVP
jgi:hypothetical protein